MLELGRVGGEQIGMPYSVSNPLVYYNADDFSRADLDPDNPPQTWEECEQGCWMRQPPVLTHRPLQPRLCGPSSTNTTRPTTKNRARYRLPRAEVRKPPASWGGKEGLRTLCRQTHTKKCGALI